MGRGPARATVAWEMAYLREQQGRSDSRRAQRRKEPRGCGAGEVNWVLDPCRLKRSGRFWSVAGEQALLGLETFWRNER